MNRHACPGFQSWTDVTCSQVAQHKITSLEAELQLAKAWTAAARKDADEAQKGLSEWEAQARLLYGQLMQVARQADEGAMSLEKELKGQAKNLVAFSRRVGFAEERLKVG